MGAEDGYIYPKNEIFSLMERQNPNNERSISASNGMTNMNFKDWVEKINRNSEKADDEWSINLICNYYKIIL